MTAAPIIGGQTPIDIEDQMTAAPIIGGQTPIDIEDQITLITANPIIANSIIGCQTLKIILYMY